MSRDPMVRRSRTRKSLIAAGATAGVLGALWLALLWITGSLNDPRADVQQYLENQAPHAEIVVRGCVERMPDSDVVYECTVIAKRPYTLRLGDPRFPALGTARPQAGQTCLLFIVPRSEFVPSDMDPIPEGDACVSG